MPDAALGEVPARDGHEGDAVARRMITRRVMPATLLVGATFPTRLSAQDAAPVVAAARSPPASVTASGSYDVRRFGALGDGSSHPVSEWLAGGRRPRRSSTGRVYVNLSSIRADYPHVQALSDEIDWAALQAAVDRALADGGGIVTAPGGVFILNRTVWFPETSANPRSAAEDAQGSPERGVSLAGAGEGSTYLCWNTDLGIGQYALNCRNRELTGFGSAGFWRDFTVCGPGTNANMGTYNCAMSGLGWGSRRHVVNVWTLDFRYGLSIIGDQGLFQRYSSHACFYGIYFDKPNPTLFGDHQFDKCVMHGRMAAVGIHPAADMPKGLWNTPIFGACPYGIWKEINPSIEHAKDMAMVSVTMNSPQFENIGMEAISGGTMGPNGVVALAPIKAQEVRLTQAQFGGRNDDFACRYQSGARRGQIMPRPAMVNIQETYQHFILDGINEEQLCWIGDEAMFKVLVPRGLKFINADLSNQDGSGLIDRCFRARKPFLLHYCGGALTNLGNGVYLEQSGKAWWGHIRELAPSRATATRHMPLVSAGGLVRIVGTKADEDARGSDLGELQFKGVLLHLNDCGNGSSVCYASGGIVPIRAAPGAAGFLRVGHEGRAVSGMHNAGPRIGTALSVAGEDGRVLIDLMGS